MDNFKISTLNFTWQNIVDYFNKIGSSPLSVVSYIIDWLIVIFFIYLIVKFAKNSRVMQLIKGILLFVFLTWLSGILNLTIVHTILSTILPSGVIALIIIFQPEIRRGLEQIGTNKLTGYFGINKDIATKTKEDIYKIVIAVEELAKTHTGALIVIQRDISLSDIVATGIEINSDISPQILVNIFVPNTPLHDGAVIIQNNKIKSAACILPLASNLDISKELGTRHRAALGMSKESDAVVIVVSEESGKVSLAKDGTLLIDLSEETLKKLLIKNIVTNRLDVDTDTRKEKIRAKREEIKRKRLEKKLKKTEGEKELKEDNNKESK